MTLGPHGAFIWASYAVVAVALTGLVVWLIAEGRRHQAALDDLEARGVRRRGAPPPHSPPKQSSEPT